MAFTFPPIPTAVPPLLQVQFSFAGGDDGPGGLVAWQNPEVGPILISLFDLNFTAPATAACLTQGGAATTKTTLAAGNLNLYGNDAHTTPLARGCVLNIGGLYLTTASGAPPNSPALLVLLGVAEWLVLETFSGASAGLVGVATIQYSPLP